MNHCCLLFIKVPIVREIMSIITERYNLRSSGGVCSMLAFILCFGIQSIQVVKAQDEAKHLGVASCSASTCHGSNVTFSDSNILRNEFRVWNENDPHARAFKTLSSNKSKRIAQNLGLDNAESSTLCLGCHSDNVETQRQGEQFRIADGIGCETCHGGAENYLDVHTSGDHQASLEKGLYPSEDPHSRAKLCVSCHVGNNSDRKITHEIMGAGHPRLSFELNTFSSIQPAHYRVDSDYVERKGKITELQVWAMGQLVATEQFLSNVESFPRSGLFPELVHMDCLGCHQKMSKITWSQNPLTKLPAGALRYNDAYLMMSYQIARAMSPEEAPLFLSEITEFLKLPANADLELNVGRLVTRLQGLQARLKQTPIENQQGLTILAALVDVGLESSHRDYAAAEQSAMAINSVLNVLDAEQNLSNTRREVVTGVNSLFNSLDDTDNYKPSEFVAGLKKVSQMLKD